MLAGDRIVRVFEYDTPTYKEALALIKGSVGGPLELTLLRSPVVPAAERPEPEP